VNAREDRRGRYIGEGFHGGGSTQLCPIKTLNRAYEWSQAEGCEGGGGVLGLEGRAGPKAPPKKNRLLIATVMKK